MNQTAPTQYRDYLTREYGVRVRRNAGYSLRAFARDLEMQPSKLSETLRGLCGLSGRSALGIARKLHLSESETVHFVTLVRAKHERSQLARRNAEEKLHELHSNFGFDEISLDRFRIIADWYHFAILELCEVEDFRANASWIAGRLGIDQKVAKQAVNRLLQFGLLSKVRGRLVQTHRDLATPSGIPSRELREHHSQILLKADSAQTETEICERDFSAVTLAIDSASLPAARVELKKFRRRFTQDLQRSARKDRVYCLAMQFFPVDKRRERKPS